MHCAAYRLGPLAVLVTCALAACQTTGDPRSGGLFGWSEDKARQRQASMEQDAALARRSADEERQRGAALTEKQSQLRSEVHTLQLQLARLLTENQSLEYDARNLLAKGQNRAAELSRLRQILEASTRARTEAQRVASQPATSGQTEALSRQSDVVRQYNQQLHREVMLLMGR